MFLTLGIPIGNLWAYFVTRVCTVAVLTLHGTHDILEKISWQPMLA